MQKVPIFADYQEQQAGDHNNLAAFARETFDRLVGDAVTKTRRFAGFETIKSSQAGVQIAPGRFYDADGAIYARRSTLDQSMLPYLAAAAQRIVVVSASGVENDTEVTARDVLLDVDTGVTEPRSVPTVKSRDANITFTQGAESADPQPPAIPSTHVAIAYVLLDTTQVVSVTMLVDNQVESSESLDARANNLEAFRAAIESRVTSLASDLAALANRLSQTGANSAVSQLYQDMARVKEQLEFPDDATDYGADRYLTEDESDADNSASLGYDAKVMEGVRFPDANADVVEMDIFAANDPNAMKTGSLLLPAYDHVLRMGIETYHSTLAIAQYGFQTFELTQMTMSRQRLRYGTVLTVCNNSAWWKSGKYDATTNTFTKDGEVFDVIDQYYDKGAAGNYTHQFMRLRQIWVDTYQEPYWAYQTVDHTITGAQVAQTFLVANDMWLTKAAFYLVSKAANEAVHVTVCEVTNGVPDLKKVVAQQTIPHTSLLVKTYVQATFIPTFLKGGKRYALVLTSNANHEIGMSSGQQYLDGTFFYSTDGAYFQGDLTKDMMLRLFGAKFRSAQVTIELEALNLDGGIRTIDILAGSVIPASTELVYEVQPNGSGAWIPLTFADLSALNTSPPLLRFRARFVGTRDIMPGLMVGGSEVKVSRPKTAFKHVSEEITLGSGSDDIYVKVILEEFDDTPHDLTCQLRIGSTTESPDATTDLALPDLPNISNRLERTFRFQLVAPETTFRIMLTGATNSAANTFHVSERVHYAL